MRCRRCDDAAVFTRRYSGESLCSRCFTDSVMRKTARTISRYKMIGNGDLVAVAVSGGKDSLALLHILDQMSRSHNFRIHAVTVDEGIAGYRDEALGIVSDYCRGLGVQYSVFSYKDVFDFTLDEALGQRGDDRTSSCAICGTLRRRVMDHAAREVGAGVIATAHNLDDGLQTYLINMLSGDVGRIGWTVPGPDGSGLRKIKPFMEIYEEEIVFYAFTNQIPFQTEPCPHMGEGVRTEIREFLNSLERQHAGIKNGLYRSLVKVSRAVRESDSKIRAICDSCGAECTGKTCSVCRIVSRFKGGQA